jgi:putative hydrolase of the HAD superfamily
MHFMTKGTILAVAFDAVGTLIHPDPPAAEVYASVARRFGSGLDLGEIRRRFGAAFAEQEGVDTLNGLVTSEERERRRWRDIVAQVLDDVADPAGCFAELYAHFGCPDAWRVDDGAADILHRLQAAGYAIAMASNYDHRLRGVVAGLDALSAVDRLVISSEIGWRKPARGFFAHLAAALELPPHAVLYVGDDLTNDYEGAREAGLQAVLFDPRGRHPALNNERLDKFGDLRLPGLA